jgi:hypothetical protein
MKQLAVGFVAGVALSLLSYAGFLYLRGEKNGVVANRLRNGTKEDFSH